MFNLPIDAKEIMLETERYRVVAKGVYSWKTRLYIEKAHKDVLGVTSWHSVDDGLLTSIGEHDTLAGHESVQFEALGSALGHIKELEAKLASVVLQLNAMRVSDRGVS